MKRLAVLIISLVFLACSAEEIQQKKEPSHDQRGDSQGIPLDTHIPGKSDPIEKPSLAEEIHISGGNTPADSSGRDMGQ
jgi:hypothetical protein|tara:strand:- start:143 stop:379 length:237 start_codon:yes stop_codon:yes gene_type:complete